MKLRCALHSWSLTPAQAVAVQRKLAGRVVTRGGPRSVRLIAGTDVAFSADSNTCIAGVVVWDVQAREVVEQHVVRQPVRFPYVPGLLSFREAPVILAALRRLRSEPDAFLFDGQGLAHPRRFGLACHVGVLLDRPAIGCAKSVLVGECQTPGSTKGSTSPLMHHDECVGLALRTRQGVKPVYVSVGHRVSLDTALALTLACCVRYRLPEPTRLADKLVRQERTCRYDDDG